MGRLKSQIDHEDLSRLVGKVEIYKSKLGKYKWIILFLRQPSLHGKKTALVYDGSIEMNRMVGIFTGIYPDEIYGKKVPFSEAHETIIEDALNWM